MAEADPRITEALADLSNLYEELTHISLAMGSPTTIGGFMNNLDRAERKAREIADKYAALRALFLDQPVG